MSTIGPFTKGWNHLNFSHLFLWWMCPNVSLSDHGDHGLNKLDSTIYKDAYIIVYYPCSFERGFSPEFALNKGTNIIINN